MTAANYDQQFGAFEASGKQQIAAKMDMVFAEYTTSWSYKSTSERTPQIEHFRDLNATVRVY